MMPLERIEPEEITDMLHDGETLEDVMQTLKELTGLDTFIAIFNFLPDENMFEIGDQHVINLKYIKNLKYFIRIDGTEPFP